MTLTRYSGGCFLQENVFEMIFKVLCVNIDKLADVSYNDNRIRHFCQKQG